MGEEEIVEKNATESHSMVKPLFGANAKFDDEVDNAKNTSGKVSHSETTAERKARRVKGLRKARAAKSGKVSYSETKKALEVNDAEAEDHVDKGGYGNHHDEHHDDQGQMSEALKIEDDDDEAVNITDVNGAKDEKTED